MFYGHAVDMMVGIWIGDRRTYETQVLLVRATVSNTLTNLIDTTLANVSRDQGLGLDVMVVILAMHISILCASTITVHRRFSPVRLTSAKCHASDTRQAVMRWVAGVSRNSCSASANCSLSLLTG